MQKYISSNDIASKIFNHNNLSNVVLNKDDKLFNTMPRIFLIFVLHVSLFYPIPATLWFLLGGLVEFDGDLARYDPFSIKRSFRGFDWFKVLFVRFLFDFLLICCCFQLKCLLPRPDRWLRFTMRRTSLLELQYVSQLSSSTYFKV